jgi:4-hydroxy-tetrahydrodipicolinate synthase
VGFGLPLIGRLLEAYPGVIVGTKDSAGDGERVEATCREFRDFSVFAGTERYLLDTLRHGGAGCISATVNVTSRMAHEVYDAHEAGREGDADALQERLTSLRTTIEAFPTIPALKGLMRELTGEEGWLNLRPPLWS